MGGEGVAEGVGRDCSADVGGFGQTAHDGEYHLAGEALAAPVEKHDVGVGRGRSQSGARAVDILVYALQRYGRHGHHPLFVALSAHAQEFLVGHNLREFHIHQLAHAQAAAVERLDDGAVAYPLGGGKVDGFDHPVDFVDGEHFGEVKSGDGCFEQERGIVVEISRDYQKMEESADARYDAFAG